ncbi:extensin-like [Sinocyclocheilus anshuiensis]|uniref:extensin-like n=1 Tax=Sinocyclocheilus anshuiensis TaxID=1608454 RepID=UPI0007BA5E0F|nr:PREDICTED: extensin-like [Sinocyclocheilus anshuiensis]
MTSTTANETLIGPHPPSYQQIMLPPLYPDKFTQQITMPEPSATLKPPPYGYPQVFPQGFWPYYYPRYHYPARVIPQLSQQRILLQIPMRQPRSLNFQSTELAEETTIDAQAPTQKPQSPIYRHMIWPYHPTSKPAEKPPSDAQAPNQKPQFPKYPHMIWPDHYPHHGKPKPNEKSVPTTTSVAQAPPKKPQPPKDRQIFSAVRPETSETATPNPGSLFPQYSHYPNYPLYLQQFYPQYPVQPPKTITASPITTTPQPCTTTAAAECKPSAKQPHKEPPKYYKPPSYIHYEKHPFKLQFVDF